MDEKEIEFYEKAIKECLENIKKIEIHKKNLRMIIYAYKQALKNKSKK